jgi:hypothetical protein
MKAAVLALAALAGLATTANADVIYRYQNLSVQLTAKPCDVAVLSEELKNYSADPARTALVVYNGKAIKACWALDSDGDVLVFDENGKSGFIDRRAFREMPAT